MKLGIVCYPTYGGSGVLATELGLGLAEKGHDVHFITYSQPARLNAFHENVYYHEVSPPKYPLFEFSPYDTALASTMVHTAQFAGLDLFHVHYAIPHATAANLAKQILRAQGMHVPVITTLHGTDITLVGNDASFFPVVEFSINQSDGVTAVSNFLRNKTLETFEITRDIQVIYNFIDRRYFSELDKDHFKKAIAPNGEKLLVHTSNFRKVKRVEDVIRIFEIVHRQMAAKLLMIGDGPERPKLEALCREMDLCDDVRFLGKQDAVNELLAVSDLFLMPSESESFGLAALEAMACGVPVVSSDIGGLPELNIDGLSGFLRPVGDVEGMGQRALHILSDETRLSQFRSGAFEQAQKFDIAKILPQYEAYYEQVLEEQRLVNY